METLSASAVSILGLCCCIIFGSEHSHLIRNLVSFPLSFFCRLLSLACFFFFIFFVPFLHLLRSQTACLAGVLCSKLAPTLYPVIIIVPSAEDVKINRSGESGGDWGRRRRRAWWLTMDLLSAATSLQRRKISNLHEKETEDSDYKERCGDCKSCFTFLTHI